MIVRTLSHQNLEPAVLGGKRLEEVPDLLLAHGLRKIVFSLIETV